MNNPIHNGQYFTNIQFVSLAMKTVMQLTIQLACNMNESSPKLNICNQGSRPPGKLQSGLAQGKSRHYEHLITWNWLRIISSLFLQLTFSWCHHCYLQKLPHETWEVNVLFRPKFAKFENHKDITLIQNFKFSLLN